MAILVQSNRKPSVSYPEQTGSIVTFNSQYAGLPLKSCKVNIPVTQEGTGDPSPDNVRNFVGISSLDFTANSVVKTFQFGQTIYAGELNVLTGIFTATHKLVDMGSLLWEYSNAYGNNLFYTNSISDMAEIAMLASSQYKYAGVITSSGEFSSIVDETIVKWRGASRVYLVDSNYTNVSSFTQMLIENNAQLLYELATPEVINLGGMEISTLQGENNLFASTGETTASYIKIGG